jgi:ribosomal-protein-alanine N-acetyltransferase
MDDPLFILETERLILRRQRASDIAALTDLWTDADVTLHMGGPRDRMSLIEAFEETAREPFAERYDLWPVVEKASGRVVGHSGLLDKDVEGEREIEVVYVFISSVWGKGYATEIAQALMRYAFQSLGLKKVIALVEPENEASERVTIKAGMKLEKEVIRPDGAIRRLYTAEASDAFGAA